MEGVNFNVFIVEGVNFNILKWGINESVGADNVFFIFIKIDLRCRPNLSPFICHKD